MNKAWFLFAPVVFMFFSCATQVAPSGGPQDTIPPAVVKQTPESFSTNFHSKEITITFDEYIQLDKLNEQLVISPPLSAFPDIRIKSKTLLINFDDTLKENKTYTFNFGNSIRDIAENNAVENFQYVFSTGAAVDTEQVSGTVINSFTLEPEKGVLVMLYDESADSLPYLDKPSYFSRTKEDGSFLVKNISLGGYKIFALKETNSNYLFDSRDESIAFAGSTIFSGSDSLTLNLFTEILPQQLMRANPMGPGKVIFVFQQPVDSFRYELLSANPEVFAEEFSSERDTVSVWYKNLSADTLSLKIISPALSRGDTVVISLVTPEKIKTREKEGATGRGTGGFKLSVQSNLSGKFDLNDTVRITFSHPIASWDSTQIILTEDTIKAANTVIWFADSLKRHLFIAAPWKEAKTYKLNIPAGAFTDVFGLNNDTLEFTFQTQPLNEYGTMKLDVNLHDTLKDINLILHLLDESGNVVRQHYLNESRAVYYEYLIPAAYRLRLITDGNGNGKWDTGNYLKKEQPEKVMYHPQKINIRANWDIEMEWSVLPESR